MSATLYMVATPIGNMKDISDRTRSTLSSVDVVFAEDTRVAQSLLQKLDINTPVERYDHHSHDRQSPAVLAYLQGGKDVAYVSDAGTPGVEDPGGRLVEAVTRTLPDVAISPIPGPSAIMAALSVSGFPADKFVVMGFAPKKKGRQTFFDTLAQTEGTVVLYEATHRIQKTIEEIATRQPDRPMLIARELTKKFETLLRGTAQELAVRLSSENTKGEFIVVVS
ncbi:16S rRNA (cytidine(1402)-2'-O)-methyltransferase [Candidatus Uhrbacteria bacterium CG10_big_fil_rev_8_21_14_0_10_50_16]|uniref:Ribosomal RNA small subunit methyltransferase I n=2 Tax=Patescibacteria group TaxID=1783273 RepID=A0A2H0RN86_9BACT|nr:MAG: 16S rRNA (cytidine(1402)-2'-O)-methyltransferase [Candidatus Uhrbacteria bacterium CG10_big_fil_rev_8_21_14_0_10_50_16]